MAKDAIATVSRPSKCMHAFPMINLGKGDPAHNNRLFDASSVEVITWIEIPNTGREKGKVIAKG